MSADLLARARAMPVRSVLARCRIQLRRNGVNNLEGACPRCGGNDRFGVNLKKNLWNCRGCKVGGNDAISLLRFVTGICFLDAVQELAGKAIERPRIAVQVPPPRTRVEKETWRAIWHEGAPIALTLAERYLSETRRIAASDPDSEALRFHPHCYFGGVHHPCLLALYRDILTNDPTGILRVALDNTARKIDRRALGRIAGSAIKLTADADVTYGLTIAEGLETTLAGMALGFRPAWSVGSAAGIREFPVLAGVDCLTILVDQDAPDKRGRRAGPEAAQECSARWTAAGREVRRVVPRTLGADLADLAARAS